MNKTVKIIIFIKIFAVFFVYIHKFGKSYNNFDLRYTQSTIIDKVSLPKESSAEQGITSDQKSNYFTASNWIQKEISQSEKSKASNSLNKNTKKRKYVSKIYKFNKDLNIIKGQFTVDPENLKLWDSNNYLPHLGQITFDKKSNLIYVSIMDVGFTYSEKIFGRIINFLRNNRESYGRRTAILIFNNKLEYLDWIDFTKFSSYLDAIHIEKGELWFASNYIGAINLENLKIKDFKKVKIRKYDFKFKGISKAQGIKIFNNNLYYVSENDKVSQRTNPKYLGIKV